jgi:predicted nucleotidyltransferase
MNSDFRDLLRLLAEHEVRYLIVGGYAAMRYSQPRLTKDLDIWIDPSTGNSERLMRVFSSFGMPLVDVTPEDFSRKGLQYMVGRSPVLFDFLTSLPGLDFPACWDARATDNEEGFPIHYLGLDDLITAKKTAGRRQDLMDLEEIERARKARNSGSS